MFLANSRIQGNVLIVSLFLTLTGCSGGGAGGFGSNKKETTKDTPAPTQADQQKLSSEEQQASAPGEVAGAFLVKQRYDPTRSTLDEIHINVAISHSATADEAPKLLTAKDVGLDVNMIDASGNKGEKLALVDTDGQAGVTYTYIAKARDVPTGRVRLSIDQAKSGPTLDKDLKDIAPAVDQELSLANMVSRSMGIKTSDSTFTTIASQAMVDNIKNGSFQPDMFCTGGKINPNPKSNLKATEGWVGAIKDAAGAATFKVLPQYTYTWYPNKALVNKFPNVCFYSGISVDKKKYTGRAIANGCVMFLIRYDANKVETSQIIVTRQSAMDPMDVAEYKGVIDAHPCKD